ncbi:MAG: hypothetical protein QME46_06680 [Thermoanaerobacteraceae bacterium]|nr:hypothetical protein [Thermoanaerobacteraceae bacterium]
MSRLEENKRYKGLFKRQVFFTFVVFLFMIAGLIFVDYYFYKNIEGTETVHILNVFKRNDFFDIILFGREIISIPIK